jgi:hypothetical protein
MALKRESAHHCLVWILYLLFARYLLQCPSVAIGVTERDMFDAAFLLYRRAPGEP